VTRDIYLYGTAGRVHGRHFRLNVASPAEAVRALMTLRPGLRQMLRQGYWRVIVGAPHLANAIDGRLLYMRAGDQPLHIVPATGAAGGGGVGKAVAGVALIGASVLTAGLAAPAGLAALGTFGGFAGALGSEVAIGGVGLGLTYGGIALAGASMVLGGISSLLTTPPAQTQATQPTAMAPPGNNPSFLFNGVTNNSQQGGPVPLVFGTHLVGSIVVSAALVAEDIAP
jgi:predicted phage tail protein